MTPDEFTAMSIGAQINLWNDEYKEIVAVAKARNQKPPEQVHFMTWCKQMQNGEHQ